jgi:pimeloyl-ACP methyl ester carboxylesterase
VCTHNDVVADAGFASCSSRLPCSYWWSEWARSVYERCSPNSRRSNHPPQFTKPVTFRSVAFLSPLLVLIAPLISPGYPISKALSPGNAFEGSRRALFDEQQQVRVERDVPELATPAFLFQGKDDWQVSTPAAVRYFERLRAPRKDVIPERPHDEGQTTGALKAGTTTPLVTQRVSPTLSSS